MIQQKIDIADTVISAIKYQKNNIKQLYRIWGAILVLQYSIQIIVWKGLGLIAAKLG